MILLIGKPLEYCLKLSGLWPYELNIFGPLFFLSILATTLPFQCWQAWEFTDSLLFMDSLSDIVTEVLIFMKLFILWKNKSHLDSILREVFDDWSSKMLPEEWKTLARYSRMFCTIDLFIYFFASSSYYPEVFISYFTKPIEKRKLVFESYYPFNCRASPFFEIIIIMQIFQGLLMCIGDSISKTLLITLIIHISAHIDLLKSYIQLYSRNCNDDHKDIYLKQIIREHLKILTLVRKIDGVYSYVSFTQLMFSNIIICVTGFVILTAMKTANVILLIKFMLFIAAMLSQAFTFCFTGQYLRSKGESIVHMVYDCLWYNTEPKRIKAVMFILMSAQAPLTLNGGKLFELSSNTFTVILKTSVSYLSVLRAIYT